MWSTANGSDIDGSGHGIVGSSFFSTTSRTILVGHIPILVGQINRLAPIRLDGDVCHPFGHIPIGALVEDAIAAISTIKILVSAFAVGKIIRSRFQFSILIGNITSGRVSSSSSTCYAHNLPASYDSIFCIVTSTYIVIVGQLHLIIIKVEVVKIFICDVE